MPRLSDKDQKKAFKKVASTQPDKYYPTRVLKDNGYHRHQCTKCNTWFWTCNDGQEVCGDPSCNAGFQVVKNNPSKNRLSYVGVWKKIVEILEPRGYKPLNRYPVVARWNPSVEFTIASIAAFQPYVIAGEVPPPAKKLLIPQFCLRFGDIENVGVTGSHCTGFVMIGQHQFVSPEEWNQEQAFKDIYDFLILGVGLDKHEVTIHEDAWAGGGNFGPCMEFFSRGVELFNQVYMMFEQTDGEPAGLKLKVLDMGLGQERVAWFSQGTPNMYEAVFPLVLQRLRERTKIELDHDLYNRFSQYSAFLNIDEVDDINQAWQRVADQMGVPIETMKAKIVPMTAIYSIAEHARALLFAISDGKLPSNVGGGYNLRVIFRRAIGFIDQFGWNVDLGDVCAWHAEELHDLFPEVSENLEEVRRILAVEKEKYYATKVMAESIVKKMIKKEEITEDQLIELYDSNGINPEIIKEAAAKLGKKIKIPDNFYAKVIARHEVKTQVHETHKAVDINIEGLPPTKSMYFDDYLALQNTAKVLKVQPIAHEIEVETDTDETTLQKIDAFAVILDQSAAYPTSGGQLHDNGDINGAHIVDVLKVGPCIVHIVKDKPKFKEGDTITLTVDKDRRLQLTQHHSATHIVNAAARELLGSHINQAGAKKTLSKAHLDITHFESLDEDMLDKIEERANQIVKQGIQSKNRFMSRSDAEKTYGMRLYQGGAVPGTQIRVVEIPGIEVEACGGTHVHNTAEVGTIKLIKSQKIQDGIVRLSFTAGKATDDLIKAQQAMQTQLAEILECEVSYIVGRAVELVEKWKKLRKAMETGDVDQEALVLTSQIPNPMNPLRELSHIFESPSELLPSKIQKMKDEWLDMKQQIQNIARIVGAENVQKLLDSQVTINGQSVIFADFPGIDNKILTNLAKNLFKKAKACITLLLGSTPQKINVILARGPDNSAIDVGMLFKKLMAETGGKGGGNKESASGVIPQSKLTAAEIFAKFKSLLN
jgi:alanyl-tRNA synthetase